MNRGICRVVLDTNIVVSAALKRDGLESKLLRRVLSGEYRLYTSLPILQEYADVLRRPKFGLSHAIVQQLIEGLETAGFVVEPRRRIRACSDPDDNMFLECDETAHAHYLITGNLRHFPTEWKETRIVLSRQFLASM
jgi:putative PIN family toxin of toxin-antitoxin system